MLCPPQLSTTNNPAALISVWHPRHGEYARRSVGLLSASSEDRWTFFQEGGATLLIICAIKARLDSALNRGEIALGRCFEELCAGELCRMDGERGVGADHGRVILHIRPQLRRRQ